MGSETKRKESGRVSWVFTYGTSLMKENETAGLAVDLGSQDSCSRRVKFEILLRHTHSGARLTGANLLQSETFESWWSEPKEGISSHRSR